MQNEGLHLRPIANAVVTSPAEAFSIEQMQQMIAYLSTQLNQQQTKSFVLESIHGAVHSTTLLVLDVSMTPRTSNFISNLHLDGNSCFTLLSDMTSSNPSTWVLGTGATHHVCNTLSLFTHSQSVTSINITLPTGLSVKVSCIGTVCLSPKFELHDVLYVPSFQFNLISISSLISTNNYQVVFDADTCVIQDRAQGLMTGRGSRHGNLYILDSQSTTSFTNDHLCFSTISSDVWHFHLGHASFNCIHSLRHELSLKQDISLPSSTHCDICHLAKQWKQPFPSLNNMSKHPFDLVHLDIWGPFSVHTINGHKYFLTIVDDHS